MFDLNSPISSFATFLKNYTDQIFYGITCSGKFFILPPENSMYNPIQNGSICNNADGSGPQSYSGIYVLTTGKNTAAINSYIENQLKEDKQSDQLSLFDPRYPLTGNK